MVFFMGFPQHCDIFLALKPQAPHWYPSVFFFVERDFVGMCLSSSLTEQLPMALSYRNRHGWKEAQPSFY
jgi:hypothetical protein